MADSPTGADERRPITVPIPTGREASASVTGTDERRPLTSAVAAVDAGRRGG